MLGHDGGYRLSRLMHPGRDTATPKRAAPRANLPVGNQPHLFRAAVLAWKN